MSKTQKVGLRTGRSKAFGQLKRPWSPYRVSNRLESTIFFSSFYAVCFVVLPKNFLASMEVTEAAEATEAKKFQKLSMPQNA